MHLQYNRQKIKAVIDLPGSKSISNRLLIINEVLDLNLKFENLSTAKDTTDLIKAIEQIRSGNNKVIDIGHAGTDMRFLTALLSIKEGDWILTGSERMKERPISELVDALKQIGAEISYLEKDGFPPLKITGKKLKGGKIQIDGSISSQFISALLLIAPALEKGIKIKIKNDVVSRSYILMTLHLLAEFGVKVSTILNSIIVSADLSKQSQFAILSTQYHIESDWSSASYLYSLVALSKNGEIILKGLRNKSSQGDSVLPEIYKHFGVSSHFENGNLVLKKNSGQTAHFEYNFTDCPDLAQTVAVTCLGLNINCHLKGLSTLKHKETDRLLALKTELEKFGAGVTITDNSLEIKSNTEHGTRNMEQETWNKEQGTSNFKLQTYKDHRMAMSFAPLALIFDNIIIEDPEVVQKSYPEFWEDLKMAGLETIATKTQKH